MLGALQAVAAVVRMLAVAAVGRRRVRKALRWLLLSDGSVAMVVATQRRHVAKAKQAVAAVVIAVWRVRLVAVSLVIGLMVVGPVHQT